MRMMDIYGFSVEDLGGKPFEFEGVRGKVLLVVNTASACGFTNLANFNQKFQLQHGMTPRAYRRQTQGAAESAGPPLPEPGHVNRKRA